MITNVDKILSDPKISRTQLSQVYAELKKLNIGIKWIDVLRKTTRKDVISTYKQATQTATKKKPTKRSKLKQLLAAIKESKPEAKDYYVLTVIFTDGTTKHSAITAQSKDKIIQDIINMTTNKEHLEGHGFSDATMILIKGKTIKDFKLQIRMSIQLVSC